jgi:hypothetical protein
MFLLWAKLELWAKYRARPAVKAAQKVLERRAVGTCFRLRGYQNIDVVCPTGQIIEMWVPKALWTSYTPVRVPLDATWKNWPEDRMGCAVSLVAGAFHHKEVCRLVDERDAALGEVARLKGELGKLRAAFVGVARSSVDQSNCEVAGGQAGGSIYKTEITNGRG